MDKDELGVRVNGIITAWFPTKNFGFLVANNEEFWFHGQAMDETVQPKMGVEVSFTPVLTKKGLRAVRLTARKE